MSILAHPFLEHAFLAGTSDRWRPRLVGYFLVLRGQVFTGDALSHVAFTGALGGARLRLQPSPGLLVATIGAAPGHGRRGRRGRADDIIIGGVFAWVLGLGVFFLTPLTWPAAAGTAGRRQRSIRLHLRSLGRRAPSSSAAHRRRGRSWCSCSAGRCCLPASTNRSPPPRGPGPAPGLRASSGWSPSAAAEATRVVGALLLLGLLAAPAARALCSPRGRYRARCLRRRGGGRDLGRPRPPTPSRRSAELRHDGRGRRWPTWPPTAATGSAAAAASAAAAGAAGESAATRRRQPQILGLRPRGRGPASTRQALPRRGPAQASRSARGQARAGQAPRNGSMAGPAPQGAEPR